jgi:haloacid dehalogenase-like hydrolase
VTGVEVVVTDLDGTLWDAHEAVHDWTRRALRELARRGVIVLVATGRRRRSTARGLERVGLADLPAVLLDGALGCRNLTEEALFQCPFSDAETATLVGVFRSFSTEPVFETDHPDYDRLAGPDPGPYQRLLTDPATLCCDLASPLPLVALAAVGMVEEGAAPALVHALNASTAGRAWAALRPPQAPDSFLIRVRPRSCSKWTGITRWLDHHRISPEAVLALTPPRHGRPGCYR